MDKVLWHSRFSIDADTQCWEWTGSRDRDGYGRVRSGKARQRGQTDLAHRLFYEMHVGPIPTGHDLHHKCGNKSCVNPQHLAPLTRRRHIQEFSPHTKLTREQADEIRQVMQELCDRFGVRPRTLAAIAEGTIWNG